MTDTTLSTAAEAALAVIRRHRTGTSFVELVAAIGAAGVPTEGDQALFLPGDRNIVLWVGVTQQVVDVVNELLTAKLAHLHPTQPLTYFIDGQVPTFPVAQRPPAGGYKEPHWAPVVINAGPSPTKTTRKTAGRSK